jgi:hypothetical protein
MQNQPGSSTPSLRPFNFSESFKGHKNPFEKEKKKRKALTGSTFETSFNGPRPRGIKPVGIRIF